MNSDRKLILLLWVVIAVLLVGSAVGGYMLLNHANQADQASTGIKGDNESLKRQVDQLRAALKASPTPTPAAIPAPPTAATATPPTPTPKH